MPAPSVVALAISTALTWRNGDPGWPAESAEVDFISAKLVNGDGLLSTDDQLEQWARDWLDESGFDLACKNATERDE